MGDNVTLSRISFSKKMIWFPWDGGFAILHIFMHRPADMVYHYAPTLSGTVHFPFSRNLIVSLLPDIYPQ